MIKFIMKVCILFFVGGATFSHSASVMNAGDERGHSDSGNVDVTLKMALPGAAVIGALSPELLPALHRQIQEQHQKHQEMDVQLQAQHAEFQAQHAELNEERQKTHDMTNQIDEMAREISHLRSAGEREEAVSRQELPATVSPITGAISQGQSVSPVSPLVHSAGEGTGGQRPPAAAGVHLQKDASSAPLASVPGSNIGLAAEPQMIYSAAHQQDQQHGNSRVPLPGQTAPQLRSAPLAATGAVPFVQSLASYPSQQHANTFTAAPQYTERPGVMMAQQAETASRQGFLPQPGVVAHSQMRLPQIIGQQGVTGGRRQK